MSDCLIACGFCSIRLHCYVITTNKTKIRPKELNSNQNIYVIFLLAEGSLHFYDLLEVKLFSISAIALKLRFLSCNMNSWCFISELSWMIKAHMADECATFYNDDLAAFKSNTLLLLLPNGPLLLIESLCAG